MDVTIKDLRETVPAKEMVAVIQQLYPKYDKTVQSKCDHGDEYGIQLRPDAEKAVLKRFAPEAAERRYGDRHKPAPRITCRVSDADYSELQQALKADGLTVQAWMSAKIEEYIKNHGKHT